MKKADSTKLKKKELKSTLVTTIEKTLNIDQTSKGLKKLRKAIENASREIASKFIKKSKNKKGDKLSPALDTSDNKQSTIKKIE